ncbi:MAG: DUF2240 family protein [Methanolinea sp.]|nr:DUF2240 family protein [Methanolinea sp.]
MSLSIAVAAPFRHARKERLKKNELVYFLAFERHWMTIEQANLLLSRAREEGLIEFEGDMVRPLFDVSGIEIPIGFKPSSTIFERSDPVQELIRRIADTRGISQGQTVSELNQIVGDRFDGNLTAEAAAVILARRSRVQFEDLLPALREHLMKKD